MSYSDSIIEFFNVLDNFSKKNAETEIFIWKTSDNTLKKIIEKHFIKYDRIFGLNNIIDTNKLNEYNDITITSFNHYNHTQFIEANNMYAGGLSALWSAYLDSRLYKKCKSIVHPIYILSPDMINSTAYSISMQFHVSHAYPMYVDKNFSLFNILWTSMKRRFWSKSETGEVDNYLIAEIELLKLFNLRTLKVGTSYLFNEIKFKIKSLFNMRTIFDETVSLAINSGKIMDEISKEINIELLFRKNSLKIAYNKLETQEMYKLKEKLNKYDIDIKILDMQTLKNKYQIEPKIGEGGSVWMVNGDGNINPNIIEILTTEITNNGGKIINGIISEVVFNDQNNKIDCVIVKTENGDNIFKPNKLFTSLGVRSNYIFNKKFKKLKKPETNIPGTGYSAYLLVYVDIKHPINSNNSHFTPIDTVVTEDGEKITLIKATSGGLIQSLIFHKNHAINNLHYATFIVFPNIRVEIIYAKSCNRALNGLNSEILTEMLPNFYSANGFGGKGVTDAAGFASSIVLPKMLSD